MCTLKIRGIGNWITESATGPFIYKKEESATSKSPLLAVQHLVDLHCFFEISIRTGKNSVRTEKKNQV